MVDELSIPNPRTEIHTCLIIPRVRTECELVEIIHHDMLQNMQLNNQRLLPVTYSIHLHVCWQAVYYPTLDRVKGPNVTITGPTAPVDSLNLVVSPRISTFYRR